MGTVLHPLGIGLCVRHFVSSIIKILWTVKLKNTSESKYLDITCSEIDFLSENLLRCWSSVAIASKNSNGNERHRPKNCFSDTKWKNHSEMVPKSWRRSWDLPVLQKSWLGRGTQTWSHHHCQRFETPNKCQITHSIS